MQGIDVSYIQGSVDWKKVRADDVDFAIIKATQGRGEGALTRLLSHFRDPRFTDNVLGASAAGLSVGVFHYLTATDEDMAVAEADYFLEAIEPYHSRISLYAAVDVESDVWLKKLAPTRLAAVVDTFTQRVYERGFQPCVYTNPSFLLYRLPSGFASKHDIWLAHWGASKPYTVPYLVMWQYGKGYVSGVKDLVDLDVGYFEPREIVRVWKVGDTYTIREGDVYSSGAKVPARLVGRQYSVLQVKDGKILLGGIMSWVKV